MEFLGSGVSLFVDAYHGTAPFSCSQTGFREYEELIILDTHTNSLSGLVQLRKNHLADRQHHCQKAQLFANGIPLEPQQA